MAGSSRAVGGCWGVVIANASNDACAVRPELSLAAPVVSICPTSAAGSGSDQYGRPAAPQVRRLLETESCISLEARAAAEEAQRRLALAQQEAATELARLRRELDRRDERIRRLEVGCQGRAAWVHLLIALPSLLAHHCTPWHAPCVYPARSWHAIAEQHPQAQQTIHLSQAISCCVTSCKTYTTPHAHCCLPARFYTTGAAAWRVRRR